MPLQILDLPDEILYACFKELLPCMGQRNYTRISFPKPLHLVRLSAVSKTFHRLALPLLWKRVEIHDHEEDKQRNPWRPTYLVKYRNIALHTQYLSVQSRPSTNLSRYVATIFTFVSDMTNLEVLRIQSDGSVNEDIIDQLHATLVTKPRLHTLIIVDYTPATTFQRLSRFPGIRYLQMSGCNGLDVLLEMMPCVEYLVIAIPRPPEVEGETSVVWTSLPIPWKTLRELTIYDNYGVDSFNNWDHIVDNFSAWRTSFPETPCPLTEFYINDVCFGFLPEHVQKLRVIGKQLCALSLGYLDAVTEEILTSVVHSCPQLHELRVVSTSLTSWQVKLPTILEAFSKLSILKRLHWNYIDLEMEGISLRHLVQGCRDILPALAEACQTLEMVVFQNYFPWDDSEPNGWTSFAILRNDGGGCEKILESEGSDMWSRLTSGWKHGGI